MQNLTIENSLDIAFARSVGREKFQTKRAVQIAAPFGFWGPWVEVYAQFGNNAPDPDNFKRVVTISSETRSRPSGTFDIAVEGGDRNVFGIGPGETRVTITGNVATALRVRLRSHTTTQNVIITAF